MDVRAETMIILSFTRAGTELNRKICGLYGQRGQKRTGYAPAKYSVHKDESTDGCIIPFPPDIRSVIKEWWGSAAFLFIGAAGIAVRYIAPFVQDKFTDSPVLVMDERGRFVIPLLSGHIGGAAFLADELAEMTGAEAVHTTATDVQGKFAVDVFAKESALVITDRKKAKEMSAAVLDGERIGFYCAFKAYEICGKIPPEIVMCKSREEMRTYGCGIEVGDRERGSAKGHEDEHTDASHVLLLTPRNMTVGIGCRKNIPAEQLEQNLKSILSEAGLDIAQAEKITSIDLKKDEPALLALAEKYHLPFETFSAEKLREVENVTARSSFVERTTGVDNVCERAALAGCRDGRLVLGKTVGDGMTAAVVRRAVRLVFE